MLSIKKVKGLWCMGWVVMIFVVGIVARGCPEAMGCHAARRLRLILSRHNINCSSPKSSLIANLKINHRSSYAMKLILVVLNQNIDGGTPITYTPISRLMSMAYSIARLDSGYH